MRDLVIHGDDVVVGTHGRSFWILDDISLLRQITDDVARSDAFFFKPATAIRIRRNINTDTPLPPEVPAGKNPPDGALLDYYLSSASSAPITLEIYDNNSKQVRRFSSTDAPEVTLEELRQDLNVPLYWIRPPQILSAAAGMHRFAWDLRLPSPGSVTHEYPISAIVHDTPRYPVGPAVLPGVYTVKLTVGAQTFSQLLEIKMDPRVTASTADLAEQFNLASQISDAMTASFRGLTEVRSLRAQIKSLPVTNQKGALANSLRAFDQKLAALESDSAPPQSTTGAAPSVVGLAKLNGDFGKLLAVVDSADARPTEAARGTFSDLQRSLSPTLAQWKDLLAHDLPALNDQLRKSKLSPLDPKLPPPHESSFEYGDEP
jgi:hypothetical protein